MSRPSNPFVWYELMTTDTTAAAAFYQSVVGWKSQDSGMPGLDYTMFKAQGRDVGAMMGLTTELSAMGVPPCWTGYVGVDDVDTYAARGTSALLGLLHQRGGHRRGR